MLRQAISILSLIAFLGSSLGIHVMHHDQMICGLDAEVLHLSDLIQHRDVHCCSADHTADQGHCCQAAAGDCQTNPEDHPDHHSCCEHEVVGLKDHYLVQKQISPKHEPVLIAILYWNFELEYLKLTGEFFGMSYNRPPPKWLFDQSSYQFTGAVRC